MRGSPRPFRRGGFGGPGDCDPPPPRTWIVTIDAGAARDGGGQDGGADVCWALCGDYDCVPVDGGAAFEFIDRALCWM